jgi:hydroxylaminobenzene mutase
MNNAQRRLMWHGMFLFLLGLLTGFAETKFANVRMGLASHLEGVMNGIFLLALGGAWSSLQLSRGVEQFAFWATLYGTYLNWLMTTLAAVFGTKALSPLTGTSNGGQPWQETLVTVGFMSVGIVIVIAAVLLLWGFRRGAQKPGVASV